MLCRNVSQLQRKSNLPRVCIKRSREQSRLEKFANYMVMTMHNVCGSQCFGLFSFAEYPWLRSQRIPIVAGPAQNIRYRQEVMMKKERTYIRCMYILHCIQYISCASNLLWAMHTCGKFHIE